MRTPEHITHISILMVIIMAKIGVGFLAPTTVPSLLLTGKASDTAADVKFDRNQLGLNSLFWCSSDEKLYHASVSNFASC